MALSYFFIRSSLLEEEDDDCERARKRRKLREKFNPAKISEKEFLYKYRVTRELYEVLCDELTPLLKPKKSCTGLDPKLKILAALNYYAWGHLRGVNNRRCRMLLSKQSRTRCTGEVTRALNDPSIIEKFIQFPETQEDREMNKQKYYEKFGFPNVLGCVDSTHVLVLKPPTEDHVLYLNNNSHTVFSQIVCDADCNILSVDSSHGGASSKQIIWSSHPLAHHMQNLDDTAYILGDASYAQQDYLMTPIKDPPKLTPEFRYNVIHKAAHSTATQTIRELKSRWRCLLANKPRYFFDMMGKIFKACCVLHNICNMAGLKAPELTLKDVRAERRKYKYATHCDYEDSYTGVEARNQLVEYFETVRFVQNNNRTKSRSRRTY